LPDWLCPTENPLAKEHRIYIGTHHAYIGIFVVAVAIHKCAFDGCNRCRGYIANGRIRPTAWLTKWQNQWGASQSARDSLQDLEVGLRRAGVDRVKFGLTHKRHPFSKTALLSEDGPIQSILQSVEHIPGATDLLLGICLHKQRDAEHVQTRLNSFFVLPALIKDPKVRADDDVVLTWGRFARNKSLFVFVRD
jgi:hypothetical protein